MTFQNLLRRRNFFTLALGSLLAPTWAQSFPTSEDESLKIRAAKKSLIYGAKGLDSLTADPQFWSVFLRECDTLVAGFYSQMIRPTADSFDFTQTDALCQFALDHQLRFRGHPLIWHRENPPWLEARFADQTTPPAEMQSLLETHVSTVVQRYAGRVYIWDVVNEGIEVNDGRSDGLGDRPWLKSLGREYIEMAFYAAAAADPQALLFYNEVDITLDDPTFSTLEARREAILNLLSDLKSQGVPIHGLGLQAHLLERMDDFDADRFRSFLKSVANLGLKILISEMDVIDYNLPRDINTRDAQIAALYERYLTIALEEPAVIGLNTWGLSDKYTWISRQDELPSRPLPLDDQMNRKPAFYAIARTFDQRP
jgi:endo-1,4-beta-xylanase